MRRSGTCHGARELAIAGPHPVLSLHEAPGLSPLLIHEDERRGKPRSLSLALGPAQSAPARSREEPVRETHVTLLFDRRHERARVFGRIRGHDENRHGLQRRSLQPFELEQLLQARGSPGTACERQEDDAPPVLGERDGLPFRVRKRDLRRGRPRSGFRDGSGDQNEEHDQPTRHARAV